MREILPRNRLRATPKGSKGKNTQHKYNTLLFLRNTQQQYTPHMFLPQPTRTHRIGERVRVRGGIQRPRRTASVRRGVRGRRRAGPSRGVRINARGGLLRGAEKWRGGKEVALPPVFSLYMDHTFRIWRKHGANRRVPPREVTLVREAWDVPEEYEFGDSVVVPFYAGRSLRWRVQ